MLYHRYRLPTTCSTAGTERIVQALFEQVYYREILFSLALARASADPIQHIRDVIPVVFSAS